jgi:hypothetical protein
MSCAGRNIAMTNVATRQDAQARQSTPFSPLRAEAETAPYLAAAQRAAMDVGASREQACWIAISWALAELSESSGAQTVAAQLEQIGLDLRTSGAKRSM